MKILIVEDSKIQEVFLQRLLSGHGHEVVGATSGEAALERLQGDDLPDVMITDIVMPGISGFELCAKIKADERLGSLPVILLTVLSDPRDIVQALESGADSFITKPYDEQFLLGQLDSVVRNRELRKSASEGSGSQGIDVYFAGETYSIGSDPTRMLGLLFATYENAIQKNKELEQANQELRDARSQLEVQNEHLAELNEQKNQFLGMAAHDLRNPLGIIQGFSTLMMETVALPVEQGKQLLQRIHGSSKFMLQLVDDLLDIAAIESGKLELRLESVAAGDIFRDCLDLNSIMAEQKQIAIQQELADGLPQLKADPSKMGQVINNLLSNAIKYSHPNTTIILRAAFNAEAQAVDLSVIDQGQGIPADELGELFKPFQKSSVRATAGEKSTGLGLTIVRRIVKEHGGRIEVQSKVGKGTRFTVRVPVA